MNKPPEEDYEVKHFFGMYSYRLSRFEQILLFLGGLGFFYKIAYVDNFNWNENMTLFSAVKNGDGYLVPDDYCNWGWAGGLGTYVFASFYNYWISNV